jgi:hypothetical protein
MTTPSQRAAEEILASDIFDLTAEQVAAIIERHMPKAVDADEVRRRVDMLDAGDRLKMIALLGGHNPDMRLMSACERLGLQLTEKPHDH